MVNSLMVNRSPKRYINEYLFLYRDHYRTYSNKHGAEIPSYPNPNKVSSDMVGPVDPVSNLRCVVWRHPTGETPLEKRFREMRMEVHNWNQMFWSNHNTNFFQEREKYIKENLPSDKQTLTADEMSVFYKAFLDRNWRAHVAYNAEWYRRNLQLLRLAVAVKFNRFFRQN